MDPTVSPTTNTVLIIVLFAVVAALFGMFNGGHFLFFD